MDIQRNYVLLALILLVSLSPVPGQAVPGFNPIGSDYKKVVDESSSPFIPPTRSGDSIDICGITAAAVLIDAEICRQNSISCKNGDTQCIDCANLQPNQRSSTLDLFRLGVKPTTVKDPNESESYPRTVDARLATGYDALTNAMFRAKDIAKESCAPLDKFVSKLATKEEQEKAELKIWEALQNKYKEFGKKSGCKQCALDYATTTAAELKQDYGLKADNLEIVKAFSAKTYEEFLGQILVPKDCDKSMNRISIDDPLRKAVLWPISKKDQNYEATMAKLKEQLKKGPVMVNYVCMLSNPVEHCPGGKHTAAIQRYQKICKVADPTNCVEAIQVESGWGESWNKAHSDGWFDPKTFLDRTGYGQQNFAWIDDVTADDVKLKKKSE
jgi:hypothetical protein